MGLAALLLLQACAHVPVHEAATDEALIVRATILELKDGYAELGEPDARFHVERRVWLPRWDGIRFADGDPPLSRLALLQGIEHVAACSPPPGARVCETVTLDHIVLMSDISIEGDTAEFIMAVLTDFDGELHEHRTRVTVVRRGGEWRVAGERTLYFDTDGP
jgi:hypothetical protein